MSFPQFRLLPQDRDVTPDDDLSAAVSGALAPAGVQPVTDPPPAPFGRTWQFDFGTGQFIRSGGAPAETRNDGAIAQWCLMAIYSARFANSVFGDDFGMEYPHGPLGEFAQGEVLADWQRHFEEALLVHDRIIAVENADLEWDPVAGVLYVHTFDVVTDEPRTVTVSGLMIERSS